MVSNMPLANMLPIGDGHQQDDEISWYDESVAANEVDIVTSPQCDKDFSEVSYSPFEKDVATTASTTTIQTRSTADLLLGTLPPAPPLADGDVPDDHVRQARLRNALSIKRREAHKLSKSLIDGGSGPRTRSRRKSSIVRKRPEEMKEHAQKVSLHHHHHSPTGVWEMFDASQNSINNNEPCPMTPVSRFSVIDAIFTRQEERRAGGDYSPNGTSYLPSSQPRQQKASLHKEWKNQISGNMSELVAQSDELMHDIMSAEERFYKKLHG